MYRRLVVALGAAVLVSGLAVAAAIAVSGAAFTTFNAAADGSSKDVCKNTAINCNIYGAKEYVWLNGGPAANGLGPDGQYFFAVLVPGGQPNPNDGGAKNLSDDYVNPDQWSVNDDYHKAARSLTAAYLNAAWGMNYPYTTTQLEAMWAGAVASGDFLALHSLLDAANNSGADTDGDGQLEHQCPISASLN